MKTFNKTYLPEEIVYNGLTYKPNTAVSNLTIQNIKLSDYVNVLKSNGYNLVLCNVLSKNLKGKIDLHNQPYKPTQWIFIAKKEK